VDEETLRAAEPATTQADADEEGSRRPTQRSLFERYWRWLGFETGKDLLTVLAALSSPIIAFLVAFLTASVTAENQRVGQDQMAQEAALQAYLDQMTQLLIDDSDAQLHRRTLDSDANSLLNARTALLMEQLDADYKRRVVGFLEQANLIPVVSLADINLRNLSLRSANLSGADLRGADLIGADLRRADLTDADLSRARVTNEQLAEAKSLQGATMPDGSQHD